MMASFKKFRGGALMIVRKGTFSFFVRNFFWRMMTRNDPCDAPSKANDYLVKEKWTRKFSDPAGGYRDSIFRNEIQVQKYTMEGISRIMNHGCPRI